MEKILLKKDYTEMISHCESCRIGATIKQFIDNVNKVYSGSNPDFLLVLMEFIEDEYPAIDNIEDLHTEDILNFKEEVIDIDRPQLHYLYSYICHLHDLIIEESKGLPKWQLGARMYVDPFLTFTTDIKIDDLIKLYNWLSNEKYIGKVKGDLFLKIFSGVPIKYVGVQVPWILSYNSNNNMMPLFCMLNFICPHEYLRTKGKNFSAKVYECFSFKSPTNADNIRKSFYDWKRKNDTGKVNIETSKLASFLSKLC